MPKKQASSKLSPVLRNLKEAELSAALAALAEAKKSRQDEGAAVRAAILQRTAPFGREGPHGAGAAAVAGLQQRSGGGEGLRGTGERGAGAAADSRGWGEEDEVFIRAAAAEDEAVLSPEALAAGSRTSNATVMASSVDGDPFRRGTGDLTLTPTGAASLPAVLASATPASQPPVPCAGAVVATPTQPSASRTRVPEGVGITEGGAGGGLLRELEDALGEAEKWKGQAERLRAKLISDRRTFSEATRRLERQVADSKGEIDRHKHAADKALQNIVKLREEANRHKEFVARHAKSEQGAREEVLRLKQKLAEANKRSEEGERRNAAAHKREQSAKDATNRLWARDRDELDKCRARIAELEVADRRQAGKLSECSAEVSRLLSMLPPVASPLRTNDTSIQTTPTVPPPPSPSPTIVADHYDHATGHAVSATIISNASAVGAEGGPSASFTDASLASKVLSSSRQIALLRNRRDMAALVSHLRGSRTASPAPAGGLDPAVTPLGLSGGGGAEPRSPATPSYALGPLPATPSWPTRGVGGAGSGLAVEGLAIRFAVRLNVGIGLLRDGADDYGENVRLQVAAAAGIASNRVLLHGVHAGGGVVDLTVRPAPPPVPQNLNLTVKTPNKTTLSGGEVTPAQNAPAAGGGSGGVGGGVRTALETVANLSAQIGVPTSGLMRGEHTKAAVSLEVLSAYQEVGREDDEGLARVLEGGLGGLLSEDAAEQLREAGRLRREAEAEVEGLTRKLTEREAQHAQDLARERERVVQAISDALAKQGGAPEGGEGDEALGGVGGWGEEGEAGRVAVAAAVREWEGLRREVEGGLGEARSVADDGGVGGVRLYGAVRSLEGPAGVFVSDVGPRAVSLLGSELGKWRQRAVAAGSQVLKLRSQAEALRRQVVDAEEVAFAKLDTIEAEHRQKDDEISRLQDMLGAARSELEGSGSDREALQARLGVAGMMLSGMTDELKGVMGGIWEVVGSLGVEGEGLGGRVDEAEGEVMVLGSRCRELEGILEGMQASMAEEREAWQAEKKTERQEREREKVEREREWEAEEQRRDREEQTKRAQWEQEKTAIEGQRAALEESLARAKALAESERMERERLKSEKEEEEAKLIQTVAKAQEEAERERERLQEEIVRERAEAEGHKTLLGGSTQRLQAELDELRGAFSALEEDKRALEEERDEDRETAERRERAFNDALEKVLELEGEIEGLTGRLDEAEVREKELARRMEEAEEGSKSRDAEVEGEMAELQERLEGRDKALGEALQRVIELEGELEGAMAREKALQGTQGEVEEAQGKLRETEEELGGREQALQEALGRVTELEGAVQAAQEKTDKADRDARQEIQEALEREREDAKVLLRDAQRGREEAQQAMDEALRTLEARTKAMEALEGALEQAQRELEARGGGEEVWKVRAMSLEEKVALLEGESETASAALLAHKSDIDAKALELRRLRMGIQDVIVQLEEASEEALECQQGIEGGGGGGRGGAMSDRELGRALDEALGQLEVERDRVAVLKMTLPDGGDGNRGQSAQSVDDGVGRARLEGAQREAREVLRALGDLAEDMPGVLEGLRGDLAAAGDARHHHEESAGGSGDRGLRSVLDELKAERDMCEMQRAIIQELRDRTRKLELRLGGSAADEDGDGSAEGGRELLEARRGEDGEDDDPDNAGGRSAPPSPGKAMRQSRMLSAQADEGGSGAAGWGGEEREGMQGRVDELEEACAALEAEVAGLRQREGDLLQSVMEYKGRIQELQEREEELGRSLEEAGAAGMGEREREERERELEEEREVERAETEEALRKLQKRVASLEKEAKERGEELAREREERAQDLERSEAALKEASLAAQRDAQRRRRITRAGRGEVGAASEEAEERQRRRSNAAGLVSKRVFAATQVEDLFSCVTPMLRDALAADSCVLYMLMGGGGGGIFLRTLLSGDVLTAYAAQMMDAILSQGGDGGGPDRGEADGGGGKEEVTHVMDVQLGGGGLLGYVVRGAEPLLCEDAPADGRYDKEADAAHFSRFVAEGLGGGELGSVMCAPVTAPSSDGEVVGVLQVCRKKGGGHAAFCDHDLEILADAGRVIGLKHAALGAELNARRENVERERSACEGGVGIAEAMVQQVEGLRSAAQGVGMLRDLREMRDGLQHALNECTPEHGGGSLAGGLSSQGAGEEEARRREQKEEEERRSAQRRKEDDEQRLVEEAMRERTERQRREEEERKAAMQDQHQRQVKEQQRQDQERLEREREEMERRRRQEEEEKRGQEDKRKEEERRREEERKREEDRKREGERRDEEEQENARRLQQQLEEEEGEKEERLMRMHGEEEAAEAERVEEEIRQELRKNKEAQKAAEDEKRRQREVEEARRQREEAEELRLAAAAAVEAVPTDQGAGGTGGEASDLRVADRYRLDLLPPLDEQFEYVQQAIALFDYDAIEDDELTFRAGDTITLIGIAQPSWYFGDLRGRVGLLPANYCQVLEG